MAQSAGAANHTYCLSAEGYDSPNECLRYGIKQADGAAPIILEL